MGMQLVVVRVTLSVKGFEVCMGGGGGAFWGMKMGGGILEWYVRRGSVASVVLTKCAN